jgi:hypothetical protein
MQLILSDDVLPLPQAVQDVAALVVVLVDPIAHLVHVVSPAAVVGLKNPFSHGVHIA